MTIRVVFVYKHINLKFLNFMKKSIKKDEYIIKINFGCMVYSPNGSEINRPTFMYLH